MSDEHPPNPARRSKTIHAYYFFEHNFKYYIFGSQNDHDIFLCWLRMNLLSCIELFIGNFEQVIAGKRNNVELIV